MDYFPKIRRNWAYQRLLKSLKLRAARLGIPTIDTAEEQARRALEEKAKKEKEERARKAAQKPASKPNFRLLGIGVIGFLILVCGIFGVNYLIQNWQNRPSATPTDLPSNPFATPLSADSVTLVEQFATETALAWQSALGIGSTMISEKDGMVMMYVPAGGFMMGSNKSVYIDEKPVYTVYLDAFWIDQTEITNAMYAKCINDGKCNEQTVRQSTTRVSYYGNPEFDNYPVIYVSWNDAKAYCEWAGRRLVTEAEWEKVASWDDKKKKKYSYPWGDFIDCSFANFRDGDGSCKGDTTEVGSYENGQSPYSVYDMSGNVGEWVADWYTAYPGADKNILSWFGQNYRVQRGGSWSHNYDRVSTTSRGKEIPTASSRSSYGFRCALSASE